MRSMLIIGLVILFAGIIGLTVKDLPFHHREEIAHVGPISASEDKRDDVWIPPGVAIAAIAVGGVLTGFALIRR